MLVFKTVSPDFIKIDKLTSEDSELKEATFETYARYLGCEVNKLKFAGIEEFGEELGYREEFELMQERLQDNIYLIELGAFGNLCYQSVNIVEDNVGKKYIEINDRGYLGFFTK